MSQKSSLLQPAKSISKVLTSNSHQDVGCFHPRLDCAEGVLDGLGTHFILSPRMFALAERSGDGKML